MKLFVYNLREFDEKPYFDRFCNAYGFTYHYTKDYPNLENTELARGYDALSVIVSDMSAPMLEKFHSLGIRYIVTRTIGTDHIDVAKAHALGIRLGNVAYPPESVANYAIMLMLMSCRRITHILKRAELQDYSLKGKMGRDISRCTVGVIGTGRIGQTVLKHLSSFGCRLLAYDLHQEEQVKAYAEYTDWDRLLEESDILTLHVPATPQNYHMLNKESFARMKEGVVLINTARGDLVDTDALIDALESGKVGAAALDVLEHEAGLYFFNLSGQVIQNRRLALLKSFPNVILSPHTAFYTREVVSNMVENSIKSFLAFQNGEANPFEI